MVLQSKYFDPNSDLLLAYLPLAHILAQVSDLRVIVLKISSSNLHSTCWEYKSATPASRRY